ncbi:MAG: hypothetical protein AB8I08_02155 [Sandaracinaceae bacterium]
MARPARYDVGTHSDGGLIAAGAILLGVGYGVSVTFAVLGDNLILLIPVVGGFIHAPINGSEGGIALGLSVSGAQLIGLIVLIAGAAHHHPNEPAQASLVPELVPGPGEAGVGLRWAF